MMKVSDIYLCLVVTESILDSQGSPAPIFPDTALPLQDGLTRKICQSFNQQLLSSPYVSVISFPKKLCVVICGNFRPLPGLLVPEGTAKGMGRSHHSFALLVLSLGVRVVQQGQRQLLFSEQNSVCVIDLQMSDMCLPSMKLVLDKSRLPAVSVLATASVPCFTEQNL